jgi:hypothetical protein
MQRNPSLVEKLHVSNSRHKANLNSHIRDNLPEEYHNCMTRINQLLKIIWKIANKSGHMDNENA